MEQNVIDERGTIFLDIAVQKGEFQLRAHLQMPARGVTVLLGPSGCGKTSILRAIAGLDSVSGRVVVQGEVWQDDHLKMAKTVPVHHRKIGYVFQEASLFDHLSVKQNLMFGWARLAEGDRRIKMEPVVELLGIRHLLARATHGLSGGERQRVAIARALLSSPDLLLMDEPLSALDPERKAEVLPYLERLNDELGIPMIYVTHSLDEAARLADHLVLLDQGRVIFSGPANEAFSRTDLALSRHDDASAVIRAELVEHDEAYGQSVLRVGHAALRVGRLNKPIGQSVRARILARDVSIAKTQSKDSSIVNIMPATIDEVAPQGHTVLLKLRCTDAPEMVLLSRITLRSWVQLDCQVGDPIFAQIKGVALMR